MEVSETSSVREFAFRDVADCFGHSDGGGDVVEDGPDRFAFDLGSIIDDRFEDVTGLFSIEVEVALGLSPDSMAERVEGANGGGGRESVRGAGPVADGVDDAFVEGEVQHWALGNGTFD